MLVHVGAPIIPKFRKYHMLKFLQQPLEAVFRDQFPIGSHAKKSDFYTK